MAMRIAPVPHFWAEVKFSMIGDLDQSIDVSFKVKYKRLEQEEYEALLARVHASRLAVFASGAGLPAKAAAAAEGATAEAVKPITDLQVIEQVVLDWDEMLGENDEKLPFTKDNLALALKALGCKGMVVKRFFDLHNKELEKNFARPPATTSGT